MSVLEGALLEAQDVHKSPPWKLSNPMAGVMPMRLYLGATHGRHFELATATTISRAAEGAVVDIWKVRHGGRATACVVLIGCGEHGKARAAVAGPDTTSPGTHADASLTGTVLSRALDASARKENVPKAMLGVSALMETHGSFLGDRQDRAVARLRHVVPQRHINLMRRTLREHEGGSRAGTEAVASLADSWRLNVPDPVTQQPPIEMEDILVLAWTVVVPEEDV